MASETKPVSVLVKPVYTLLEYCEAFSSSRSVAYEEIKAGRLRSFKFRSSTRIAGEDAIAHRDLYRNQGA